MKRYRDQHGYKAALRAYHSRLGVHPGQVGVEAAAYYHVIRRVGANTPWTERDFMDVLEEAFNFSKMGSMVERSNFNTNVDASFVWEPIEAVWALDQATFNTMVAQLRRALLGQPALPPPAAIL